MTSFADNASPDITYHPSISKMQVVLCSDRTVFESLKTSPVLPRFLDQLPPHRVNGFKLPPNQTMANGFLAFVCFSRFSTYLVNSSTLYHRWFQVRQMWPSSLLHRSLDHRHRPPILVHPRRLSAPLGLPRYRWSSEVYSPRSYVS